MTHGGSADLPVYIRVTQADGTLHIARDSDQHAALQHRLVGPNQRLEGGFGGQPGQRPRQRRSGRPGLSKIVVRRAPVRMLIRLINEARPVPSRRVGSCDGRNAALARVTLANGRRRIAPGGVTWPT